MRMIKMKYLISNKIDMNMIIGTYIEIAKICLSKKVRLKGYILEKFYKIH